MTELNLLVVSIDILSECLWLTEIEWSTLNLQDFTCWDSCIIGRKIEVGVDFADLVLNTWSRISCTTQCKEGVMCQVDDGLLVCGSQILDNQLVLVGECEFNCYIELACETFLTVR